MIQRGVFGILLSMTLLCSCVSRNSVDIAAPKSEPAPASVQLPGPTAQPVQAAAQPVPLAAKPKPTGGGIALGPALALVQQVPLGQKDVELAGLTYRVENRGATELPMAIAILPPAQAGTVLWELGYEPVPDPSWISVVMAGSDTLAAGEARDFRLRVQIPNELQWANRRFVACVTARPGRGAGVGAGLNLAARLLIETAASDNAEGSTQALATAPSSVRLTMRPGDTSEATVLIRRPTGPVEDATLVWKRLSEVEPEAVRRDRYRTPGTAEAPSDMVSVSLVGEAPPGAWQVLRLALHAPIRTDATSFEELLVVCNAHEIALAADPQRTRQPQVALIRCIITRDPQAQR